MLDFEVEDINSVPEAQRNLYAVGENGKHYLQVKGAVAKAKLDEFRNTNISLTQKLEAYTGIDPVAARKAIDLAAKIDAKQLLDAGKVDEVVAQRVNAMKGEHETVVKDLSGKLEVATKQLEVLIIDSNVKSAAVASGVLPTAVDDVVLRAKTTFRVQDGKAVAVDASGNVMYGVDGQTPLSIDAWMKNLKTSAPHLFAGSQGGGGQGGRGGSVDMSKMTAAQKIAHGLRSGAVSGAR